MKPKESHKILTETGIIPDETDKMIGNSSEKPITDSDLTFL